jgi:hypothetical protein
MCLKINKMSSTSPGYVVLVKLLPTLRNLVDGCGEVTLTADESALIRSLGFPATEGRWKVPPLPFELVRDNQLLEHLSIGWDSRQDVTQSRETIDRRIKREITSALVAEVAQKILCELENARGQIPIRRLQSKFWKFPRKAFHLGLSDLVSHQLARLEGRTVALQAGYAWRLPRSHNFRIGHIVHSN